MVSNVESSVKSTNSKSVVKSIKSVFSKKTKSKDKAPEVKTAEEESIERNTEVENIDGVCKNYETYISTNLLVV